jgi:glycosyltransferase involved in cell wall biosynthesis
VRRVLDDGELRAELRAKALRRAADFSWDKTARGVLAVYEAVTPRG